MSVVPLPTREPFARRSGLPRAYLLDCDPDLGRLLSPARLVDARRQLRVPVAWLDRGPWEPRAEASHAGVLILDGLLMRDVLVADDAAAELLGPGDYLPANPDADRLLPSDVRWTAIAPTQVALLGHGLRARACSPSRRSRSPCCSARQSGRIASPPSRRSPTSTAWSAGSWRCCGCAPTAGAA